MLQSPDQIGLKTRPAASTRTREYSTPKLLVSDSPTQEQNFGIGLVSL